MYFIYFSSVYVFTSFDFKEVKWYMWLGATSHKIAVCDEMMKAFQRISLIKIIINLIPRLKTLAVKRNQRIF